jgi:hypothetical protein
VSRPRLSLSGLMVALGLLAVDLAVARAVFLNFWVHLVSATLVALSLQVAIVQLIRRRERRRPFRTAFVFTAAIVFGMWVWAEAFPKGQGLMHVKDPVTGRETLKSSVTEGSTLWYVCAAYAERVEAAIVARSPGFVNSMETNPFLFDLFELVVFYLPMAVIATAGGLLGWGFARFIDQAPRQGAGGGLQAQTPGPQI